MIRTLVVLFFVVFLLIGCKKPEDRTCWKSHGKEVTKEIMLPSFSRLYLHEHMEFVLVQDSIEKITITGGENMLNFIEATVTDGLLDIQNKNKCSFLRSYKKKIIVEIHFKSLINILFQGTLPLTNRGVLKFDWLTFLLKDGAGSVNLNLEAESLHATISHGWGDFTFSGKTKKANITVRSNGFCDTYGLEVSDVLTVISKTPGAVKVNADGSKIKAQIDADGNIYYIGSPAMIELNRYGNGNLMDAN